MRAWPVALTLICAALCGCTHSIEIKPDLAKLERAEGSPQRIPAHAGYYIAPEVSSVEITTQGGAGDNVRYYPYRDFEAGFQKMLSNVFTDVVKLEAPTKAGIDYVVVPTIITTSDSYHPIGMPTRLWPPAHFSVDLACSVRDATGRQIASPRVVGIGSAGTSEKIHDHGFAGERAMEDALEKMQAALLETNLPRSIPAVRP
jgi:hypothetical protein